MEAGQGRSAGWGPNQTGAIEYGFLVFCVVAQVATILITWSVWQIRSEFPNLPWIAGTPQFPCGVMLLLALAGVLISPRRFGMSIYLGVLAVAILMDQFRCQPQILSITVLMAACVWPGARRFAYWYVMAVWAWAGIHKLISPDWLGSVSYYLLAHPRIQLSEYYFEFSIVVAVSEIVLAVVAWIRPRIAIILCVGIHVGVVIFLLTIEWNYSVIPWNLCMALVGSRLLWTVTPAGGMVWPVSRRETVMALVLMLLPIAFYFGLVRHCFVHVLYSGNLPQAAITYRDGVVPLRAIKIIAVPFPHTVKAYRGYFLLTGAPGEKMHIRDPRRAMSSHFYVMSGDRGLKEISVEEFGGVKSGAVGGIQQDDRRAVFQLELGHARLLKRSENEMVYAIEFDPEHFHPRLLQWLVGLPNLEQIQLADCPVGDEDLRSLVGLVRLEGIGLDRTAVTDAGLEILKDAPRLEVINHEGTAMTPLGIERFLMEVFRREAFRRE